jgi:hypothetical protein
MVFIDRSKIPDPEKNRIQNRKVIQHVRDLWPQRGSIIRRNSTMGYVSMRNVKTNETRVIEKGSTMVITDVKIICSDDSSDNCRFFVNYEFLFEGYFTTISWRFYTIEESILCLRDFLKYFEVLC